MSREQRLDSGFGGVVREIAHVQFRCTHRSLQECNVQKRQTRENETANEAGEHEELGATPEERSYRMPSQYSTQTTDVRCNLAACFRTSPPLPRVLR